MSRALVRGLTASVLALAVGTGSLMGIQAASAAPDPGTVVGVPKPPKKVLVKWDEYTGFTVDWYVAVVQPGNRTIETDAATTQALFEDLSWGQNYTVTVTAMNGAGPTQDLGTRTLRGTKLSATLAKSKARKGTKVGLNGQLRWGNDKPIRNKFVIVQVAYKPFPPFNYSKLKKVKTNKRGKFSTKVPAKKNAVYRVMFKKKNTAGGWDGSMFLTVTRR